MYHYAAHELSTKQNYKFLTGSIIPRPIAWITTIDPTTRVVNAAPFSYFNVVSKELPLVSVSINRKPDGQIKDTARNLLAQKEAVIHLVNDTVLTAMNQTAAPLEATESELLGTSLTLVDSHHVKVPAIAEAPIRFETLLHQYVPLKHQEQIITDLFILEVTDYYFQPEIFDHEKQYILPEKFSPIARLAGDNYSHIDHFIQLKRPD